MVKIAHDCCDVNHTTHTHIKKFVAFKIFYGTKKSSPSSLVRAF